MSAPIILCASISATWAPGINRAAEILREHHPGADDATVLELLILHGVFDVIDRQNNGRPYSLDQLRASLADERQSVGARKTVIRLLEAEIRRQEKAR